MNMDFDFPVLYEAEYYGGDVTFQAYAKSSVLLGNEVVSTTEYEDVAVQSAVEVAYKYMAQSMMGELGEIADLTITKKDGTEVKIASADVVEDGVPQVKVTGAWSVGTKVQTH